MYIGIYLYYIGSLSQCRRPHSSAAASAASLGPTTEGARVPTYVCVCVYIYIYMFLFIDLFIHLSIYVCMYIYIYIYMYISFMCIYIYIYIHSISKYTYICIHVYVYVHTYGVPARQTAPVGPRKGARSSSFARRSGA